MSAANGRVPPADERRWQYRDLACGRCGAVVQVAKFSAQHTGVQWPADAVRQCAEFEARAAAGVPSALVRGCGSLSESIDAAARDGRLEVLPP